MRTQATKHTSLTMTKSKSSGKCANATQISFQIEDIPRSKTTSTKKVSWKFSLLSPTAEGQEANINEKQDQMVRLLWSSDSSGIARVTLFSSKAIRPTPSSCGPGAIRTIRRDTVVEFTWKSNSCNEFRVVAYSVASPVFRQYELFIDGVSFFDFEERTTQSLDDIATGESLDESKLKELQVKESISLLSAETLPHNTPISNGVNRDKSDNTKSCESIFSFDKCDNTNPSCDQYQNMSASLLPDIPSDTGNHLIDNHCKSPTESQAIHMAFSNEESIPYNSLFRDSSSIEANALCDAYDFMKQNKHLKSTNKSSALRSFLHNHLTQMVNSVRLGAISPIAAARTIHSIEMITGLAEFPDIWEVTVVFFGLSDAATSLDLRDAMEQFGEIGAVGVAFAGRGFGFCSFRSSSSAWYSIQACRNREILLNGESLCAMRIQNGKWSDPIFLPHSSINRSKTSLSCSELTNEKSPLTPSDTAPDKAPLSPPAHERCEMPLSPITPNQSNLSSQGVANEKGQTISESVASVTPSLVQKESNLTTSPKSPIRFVRNLFKSPKTTHSESAIDTSGAPLVPMLGTHISTPEDYGDSDRCLGNPLLPPMIIRSASLNQSDNNVGKNRPTIIVRSRSSITYSSNDFDLAQIMAQEKKNATYPHQYKHNNDCPSSREPLSIPCCPSDNNKRNSFSPLSPGSRSSRNVIFGLSPLKPKSLFSRRC